MFERIVIGIGIGAVAAFLLAREYDETSSVRGLVYGCVAIVAIAFIGSSFMFGAIFGVMAIGELVLGYWLAGLALTKSSDSV